MLNRREFSQLGLAALPTSRLLAASNSAFGGVRIGVIAPYSFRGLDGDAASLLENIVALGLGTVEMQSPPIERFAGAPTPPPRRRPPGGRGPGAGGGRRAPTPEEIAARRTAAEDLRRWRLSASMEKFTAFRKMYEEAGVRVELVKFNLGPGMPDEEVAYCFEAAKALGCRGITCEPPLSATKRLGEMAAEHQVMLYYHGHARVDDPEAFARPESWEQAFSYSKYNGANIDVGHFTAGNRVPPTDFIRKHHERIANLHLKDRKINQGPNVPWGEGDTPIAEILRLVQREKWDITGTIELEYPVPDGSDVMSELRRCVDYCKKALA